MNKIKKSIAVVAVLLLMSSSLSASNLAVKAPPENCATTVHVAAHYLADLYGMSYTAELTLYNALLEACVLGQE